MANYTTHWETRNVEYDGEAVVYKHRNGVKKVSKGGGSFGIITVSKECIGKKYKVILIPVEEDEHGKEEVSTQKEGQSEESTKDFHSSEDMLSSSD